MASGHEGNVNYFLDLVGQVGWDPTRVDPGARPTTSEQETHAQLSCNSYDNDAVHDQRILELQADIDAINSLAQPLADYVEVEGDSGADAPPIEYIQGGGTDPARSTLNLFVRGLLFDPVPAPQGITAMGSPNVLEVEWTPVRRIAAGFIDEPLPLVVGHRVEIAPGSGLDLGTAPPGLQTVDVPSPLVSVVRFFSDAGGARGLVQEGSKWVYEVSSPELPEDVVHTARVHAYNHNATAVHNSGHAEDAIPLSNPPGWPGEVTDLGGAAEPSTATASWDAPANADDFVPGSTHPAVLEYRLEVTAADAPERYDHGLDAFGAAYGPAALPQYVVVPESARAAGTVTLAGDATAAPALFPAPGHTYTLDIQARNSRAAGWGTERTAQALSTPLPPYRFPVQDARPRMPWEGDFTTVADPSTAPGGPSWLSTEVDAWKQVYLESPAIPGEFSADQVAAGLDGTPLEAGAGVLDYTQFTIVGVVPSNVRFNVPPITVHAADVPAADRQLDTAAWILEQMQDFDLSFPSERGADGWENIPGVPSAYLERFGRTSTANNYGAMRAEVHADGDVYNPGDPHADDHRGFWKAVQFSLAVWEPTVRLPPKAAPYRYRLSQTFLHSPFGTTTVTGPHATFYVEACPLPITRYGEVAAPDAAAAPGATRVCGVPTVTGGDVLAYRLGIQDLACHFLPADGVHATVQIVSVGGGDAGLGALGTATVRAGDQLAPGRLYHASRTFYNEVLAADSSTVLGTQPPDGDRHVLPEATLADARTVEINALAAALDSPLPALLAEDVRLQAAAFNVKGQAVQFEASAWHDSGGGVPARRLLRADTRSTAVLALEGTTALGVTRGALVSAGGDALRAPYPAYAIDPPPAYDHLAALEGASLQMAGGLWSAEGASSATRPCYQDYSAHHDAVSSGFGPDLSALGWARADDPGTDMRFATFWFATSPATAGPSPAVWLDLLAPQGTWAGTTAAPEADLRVAVRLFDSGGAPATDWLDADLAVDPVNGVPLGLGGDGAHGCLALMKTDGGYMGGERRALSLPAFFAGAVLVRVGLGRTSDKAFEWAALSEADLGGGNVDIDPNAVASLLLADQSFLDAVVASVNVVSADTDEITVDRTGNTFTLDLVADTGGAPPATDPGLFGQPGAVTGLALDVVAGLPSRTSNALPGLAFTLSWTNPARSQTSLSSTPLPAVDEYVVRVTRLDSGGAAVETDPGLAFTADWAVPVRSPAPPAEVGADLEDVTAVEVTVVPLLADAASGVTPQAVLVGGATTVLHGPELLQAGVYYQFEVAARNASGDAPTFAGPVSGRVPPVARPLAPTDLQLTLAASAYDAGPLGYTGQAFYRAPVEWARELTQALPVQTYDLRWARTSDTRRDGQGSTLGGSALVDAQASAALPVFDEGLTGSHLVEGLYPGVTYRATVSAVNIVNRDTDDGLGNTLDVPGRSDPPAALPGIAIPAPPVPPAIAPALVPPATGTGVGLVWSSLPANNFLTLRGTLAADEADWEAAGPLIRMTDTGSVPTFVVRATGVGGGGLSLVQEEALNAGTFPPFDVITNFVRNGPTSGTAAGEAYVTSRLVASAVHRADETGTLTAVAGSLDMYAAGLSFLRTRDYASHPDAIREAGASGATWDGTQHGHSAYDDWDHHYLPQPGGFSGTWLPPYQGFYRSLELETVFTATAAPTADYPVALTPDRGRYQLTLDQTFTQPLATNARQATLALSVDDLPATLLAVSSAAHLAPALTPTEFVCGVPTLGGGDVLLVRFDVANLARFFLRGDGQHAEFWLKQDTSPGSLVVSEIVSGTPRRSAGVADMIVAGGFKAYFNSGGSGFARLAAPDPATSDAATPSPAGFRAFSISLSATATIFTLALALAVEGKNLNGGGAVAEGDTLNPTATATDTTYVDTRSLAALAAYPADGLELYRSGADRTPYPEAATGLNRWLTADHQAALGPGDLQMADGRWRADTAGGEAYLDYAARYASTWPGSPAMFDYTALDWAASGTFLPAPITAGAGEWRFVTLRAPDLLADTDEVTLELTDPVGFGSLTVAQTPDVFVSARVELPNGDLSLWMDANRAQRSELQPTSVPFTLDPQTDLGSDLQQGYITLLKTNETVEQSYRRSLLMPRDTTNNSQPLAQGTLWVRVGLAKGSSRQFGGVALSAVQY